MSNYDFSAQRSSITVFDLVDAQNIRARSIADAVDAENILNAQALAKSPAPLSQINDLMRQANLQIIIEIQRGEEITARKGNSASFSIAQLSDGERNALLIAASVLTAKPNSVILIDEPERHLHRSIISPLLTQLFTTRKDCAFVVSTHDIGLPLDNKASQTLIVRSCRYSGSVASAWDAELIPPAGGVDEDVRIDILGSREKIIFVEGNHSSLDYPLYNILFPNVSIIPKQSCRDVEHYVSSIRESSSLHWISAWGIIDRDGRSDEDRSKLRQKGVASLQNYSVEAIYYQPEMIRRMAIRHAQVVGGDPSEMKEKALAEAISGLKMHKSRLCERVAEGKVRAEIFRSLPTIHSIRTREAVSILVDVDKTVSDEVAIFDQAVLDNNVAKLLGRYPVRETPALDAVARCLAFKDRSSYEGAVRKYIIDEPEALAFIRSSFEDLIADMNTQSGTTFINVH